MAPSANLNLAVPTKSENKSLSSLALMGNKTSLKSGLTYFPSQNHKKKPRFIRNNYLHLSCCLSVTGCSKSDSSEKRGGEIVFSALVCLV